MKPRPIIIEEGFAKVPLSKGLFALIDLEDINKVSNYNWSVSGRYATRRDKNGSFLMHNVIMNFISTHNSTVIIDHLDGDGLNNRKYNLRISTRSMNALNSARSRNAKLVVKWGNSYKVRAYIDGTELNLGIFSTEKEAVEAANAYKRSREWLL